MANAKELLINLCNHYRDHPNFYLTVSEELFKVEKNGEVASHVKKLQFLFKTPQQAARWLRFYAEHSEANQPLHDLCMFIQPPMGKSIFPHLGHFGEGNLQYLFKNPKKWSFLTLYHQRFLIPEVIPTLKSLSIKDVIRGFAQKLDQEQEAELVKSLGELSPANKANLALIRKINQRFNKPLYEHAEDILNLMSSAKNSDESLPYLTLQSEEIGLPPGYYFTKLSEHNVRGAMIGHFLGCCQHVGGEGDRSAKHAVNSEFGATYVIFKGKIDANNRTIINRIHDHPIVGSWVWTDNKSFIVFDSVEIDKKIEQELSPAQLTTFFKEYVDILITLAPPHLRTVVVGTRGKTPKYLGHEILHNLHYTNDQKYTDAKTVRVLNSRDYPYAYQNRLDEIGLVFSKIVGYQNPDLKFNFQNHCDALLIKNLPGYTPVPPWVKDLLSDRSNNFNTASFINDLNPALGIWVATHNTILARILINHLIRKLDGHSGSYVTISLINEILPHLKKHLTPEICHYHSGHSSVISELANNRDVPFFLIEALLDLGANPSIYDGRGRPLLHWIADRQEVTPEWLERYKIDLHQVDVDGQNCLHMLCVTFCSQELVKKMMFYIGRGVNPRLKSQPRESLVDAFVPLHKMLGKPDITTFIPKKWVDEVALQLTEEEIEIGVKACTSQSSVGTFPLPGSLYEYFREVNNQGLQHKDDQNRGLLCYSYGQNSSSRESETTKQSRDVRECEGCLTC